MTAEAVLRVNAMRGKEEMWTLEHAIAAIKEGSTEEALELLSERLKKAKLLRRKGIMELSNDEDWSSDDEAPPQPPPRGAAAAGDADLGGAGGRGGATFGFALCRGVRARWTSRALGKTPCCGAPGADAPGESSANALVRVLPPR